MISWSPLNAKTCLSKFSLRLFIFLPSVLHAYTMASDGEIIPLVVTYRYSMSINANFDLDLFFKGVRLLVACKSHSGVRKKLMSDDIANGVIFIIHGEGPRVSVLAVVRVLNPKER